MHMGTTAQKYRTYFIDSTIFYICMGTVELLVLYSCAVVRICIGVPKRHPKNNFVFVHNATICAHFIFMHIYFYLIASMFKSLSRYRYFHGIGYCNLDPVCGLQYPMQPSYVSCKDRQFWYNFFHDKTEDKEYFPVFVPIFYSQTVFYQYYTP